MKAIETIYRGYRFRSRLEARWAVFLDAMGIAYVHEREGYDLDGLYYLPDFWLPLPKERTGFEEAGYWLEIKPRSLLSLEKEQIKRLVQHTEHNAYAICGNIGLGEYSISKWAINRNTKEVSCVIKESLDFYTHLSMWNPLQPSTIEVAFEVAISKARAARFEHGESPNILSDPPEKWRVNSLGLSNFDGGGRDWWIEAESLPGEIIYFCGNDSKNPNAATIAEQIVEAHNAGDYRHLRQLAEFARSRDVDDYM